MEGDRRLRWAVVQRSYWVNGVGTMRDYLESCARFTMDGRAQDIRCPTLLTSAELDPLGKGAPAFLERLT